MLFQVDGTSPSSLIFHSAIADVCDWLCSSCPPRISLPHFLHHFPTWWPSTLSMEGSEMNDWGQANSQQRPESLKTFLRATVWELCLTRNSNISAVFWLEAEEDFSTVPRFPKYCYPGSVSPCSTSSIKSLWPGVLHLGELVYLLKFSTDVMNWLPCLWYSSQRYMLFCFDEITQWQPKWQEWVVNSN